MKEEQTEIKFNSVDEVSTALADAAASQQKLSERWHALFGDLDKVPMLDDLTSEKRTKVVDEIHRQIKDVQDGWWQYDGKRGWHQWAISCASGFSDVLQAISPKERVRLRAEYDALVATIQPCSLQSAGRA